MMRAWRRFGTLAVAAGLAACSFPASDLLPTLSSPDPRGVPDTAASAAPPPPAPTPPATLDTAPGKPVSTVAPAAATPPPPGSVAALRAELQRLNDDLAQHRQALQGARRQLDTIAGSVDGIAAGIETRLASSSVPNDPRLAGELTQAEGQITKAGELALQLNSISSWATSDAAHASYIIQAVRAATGSPGLAEGDRRQLGQLQGDAEKASAAVDQLVTETSGEIASRNLYIAASHRRLTALGNDVAAGRRGIAVAAATPHPAAPPPATSSGPGDRRALVTIRFDRPNVAYEDELYGAVKEALDRRPDIAFDIVAVTPPGRVGTPAVAERNVESVVRSLGNMGLPPERFRLSAATRADASGDEVRIYVR